MRMNGYYTFEFLNNNIQHTHHISMGTGCDELIIYFQSNK